MSIQAPIAVQIAALGGQGGGVLAEWLAEAAGAAGYAAQATSIPGVAQRTGATTYYLEMARDPAPAPAPLFSLYPDEDGVDLLVALEPLEAARALSLGLVTRRTTVITGARRIFSTAEKMVAGDGAIKSDDLLAPLEAAAGKVIALDPDAGQEKPARPGNAVFLGAVAASGQLPLDDGAYRQAIAQKGVAIEANIQDFERGRAAATEQLQPEPDTTRLNAAPPGFDADLATYPEAQRPLIGHALARLVDYQDTTYAQLYLTRLASFTDADQALLTEVATRLAARMSYEDVIRVAQLKTRPGRLGRIRDDLDLADDAPLRVTDFLKPGREEFASLMPPKMGARYLAKRAGQPDTGNPIRLDVTSFTGQLKFKILASLKWWRPKSYRYHQEQQAIETWLGAVNAARAVDAELAQATAELSILARGYGAVRLRGDAKLEHLFTDWEAQLAADSSALLTQVKALLHAARHDPDTAACSAEGGS